MPAQIWRAARSYIKEHAGGLVTTADFVRSIFDATGRNVEHLVEQWVEGGGYPEIVASFNEKDVTRGSGPLRLVLRQAQDTTPPVPLFDVPLEIDLHFGSGKVVRHTVALKRREETFELPLEGELIDIVLDPDCKLLCAVELEKSIPMWLHQGELTDQIGARWRALEALHANVLNPSVQEFILNTLRNDPEPLMRAHAARLADFPQAPPILVLAVLRDEEAQVRLAAMESLGRLYLTDRQRALLELHLDNETSPGVIARIREIIGLR